jgi:hypothetical protein
MIPRGFHPHLCAFAGDPKQSVDCFSKWPLAVNRGKHNPLFFNALSQVRRLDYSKASKVVQIDLHWSCITRLVGSTPETAGEGAVILCEVPLPIANIASELANLATVEILSELPLPPD